MVETVDELSAVEVVGALGDRHTWRRERDPRQVNPQIIDTK
jgi:hypothetical protein